MPSGCCCTNTAMEVFSRQMQFPWLRLFCPVDCVQKKECGTGLGSSSIIEFDWHYVANSQSSTQTTKHPFRCRSQLNQTSGEHTHRIIYLIYHPNEMKPKTNDSRGLCCQVPSSLKVFFSCCFMLIPVCRCHFVMSAQRGEEEGSTVECSVPISNLWGCARMRGSLSSLD